MSIRMIGLDIDGTTIGSDGQIPEENRRAMMAAMAKGVHVVVATGRVFSAVTAELRSFPGLRYMITSNGAHVRDLIKQRNVYDSYLEPEAIRAVIALARKEELCVEAFYDGRAFIDAPSYLDVQRNGSRHRGREYVLSTRKPLEDIFAFMESHIEELENINLFFSDMQKLERIRADIQTIPRATITSSLPNNIEIGGLHSSKRRALEALMAMLDIAPEELLCCGDAPNDVPMLELAGIGVAMGNAWGDTKAHADYVTGTNDEAGVAQAIRRFVL